MAGAVEPLEAGSELADERALHEPDRTVIRLDVTRALTLLSDACWRTAPEELTARHLARVVAFRARR